VQKTHDCVRLSGDQLIDAVRSCEAEVHDVSCAGHRKAVSYVRYLNENELVSASTDSTLRLWNIEQHAMTRLFEGHLNEKNFVGLSADGEFIACGSELNEVRQHLHDAMTLLSDVQQCLESSEY